MGKRGLDIKDTLTRCMSADTAVIAEKRPETQDLNNVLTHIKNLEQQKQELEKRLEETEERAARMSQKTKAAMQSAMDTLMKKWMDAVETKEDTVKQQFKTGLDTLINKSADENGVWQMMVAASALHERQEHNLEKLRGENNELRGRVDSSFATQESRVAGKRKAEADLGPGDVAGSMGSKDMWADFATDIGRAF